MDVFQNVFGFFLPSRRRRVPPVPYAPQPAPVVEGLNEAFAVVDALDISEEVAENVKKDLKAAFDVRAEYRPGYEPGRVPAVEVNLLELITSPFETAWETLGKSFEMGLPSLDVAWREPEDEVLKSEFLSVWKDVVPYTTQQSHLRWLESTGSLVAMRISRDKGLLSAPGTIYMMSNEMLKYYGSGKIPITPEVSDKILRFSKIAVQAQEWEGKIGIKVAEAEFFSKEAAEALKAGDVKKWGKLQGKLEPLYKEAGDLQKEYAENVHPESLRKETIRDFERHIAPGGPLADTQAAKYWRYWKLRDLHYNALNLLRTYKKDGLSGVFRAYVWKEVTKRVFAEGTWRYYLYTPNLIIELRKRTADKLLKPVLNRLTSLKSLATKLWKGTIGAGVKKVLIWLGEKLGLKALGAAIGSVIPGAGTAIGAIVGVILQFVADLAIKKIVVPVFKIIGYAVAASFFFMVGTVGIVIIIASSLSNTLYPWETGGGAGRLANVCEVANAYNIPCCQLKGVMEIETGSGTGGTGSCQTNHGSFSCCTGTVCGSAQVACGQYNAFAGRDEIDMCSLVGSAELLARAMLLKLCQADGVCDSYAWDEWGDYVKQNYKVNDGEYTAAAYFYGLAGGCTLSACSQFRWGAGKGYCDSVEAYCETGNVLPDATDGSFCEACNEEIIRAGQNPIDCSGY